MTDWTVVIDDHMVARLDHCSACGQASLSLAVGLYEVGALAVPYALCGACRRTPGADAALRVKLAQRYARSAAAPQPGDDVHHGPHDRATEQRPEG